MVAHPEDLADDAEELRADDPALLLAGRDIIFVPGDPPRAGRFVVYDAAHPARAADGTANGTADETSDETSEDGDGGDHAPRAASWIDRVELVLRRGKGVRRRSVPARFLSVTEALPLLLDPADGMGAAPPQASVLAWSATMTSGLGLLARGRLLPAITASGLDAWRIGPLDPDDHRLLGQLSRAFPASAYPVAVAGSPPLRLHDPAWLIRAAWDALADALVRTPAAPLVAGGPLFAALAPQPAAGLRDWLAEAGEGLEGGASVALRLEFVDPEPGERRPGEGSAPGADGPVTRAVLQLASRVDPSLVVDAADLFAAPAAVLARFGEQAEEDLLLALRRGSRAWPPLGPLLRQRVPSVLDLDPSLVAELIGEGATALAGAGIDVLWPAELLSSGRLALRGAVTPAPGAIVGSGLDLQTLLQFRWQVTLDGEALTEAELDQLAEAKRGLVRLRGRWVLADAELIARAAARRDRARPLGAAEALGLLLAGEVDLDGVALPVVAEGPLGAWADQLRAATQAPIDLSPPPGLAGTLRPYQQRGVAWLDQMGRLGLGGCLADDMGLGKTIQVIALHLLRRSRGEGPTLVVCPTSLLGNWERECQRFAPGVPVRRYHGGARHLDDLAPDEVVVASYGVVRRDHEELAAAGFALVVADEAQNAKNPFSDTARSLRRLAIPTRVALSGTPVENRLSELWSILDWTTPGLLGPLERFRRTVATPIERHQDREATERLSRVVRPFLLRRRKSDPAIAPELPPRTVTDRAVPLTSEQATLYAATVKETMAQIEAAEGIQRRGLVLRLLTALKQICNHPAQYLHQPGPVPGRSGKMAALEELIEVIVSEGESVLVFSQFVEMLTLIEARLTGLRIGTLFLHGHVPAPRREEMVTAFQAGAAPVFLLSLKAGGVGLNLTRATHVVHFDRWWNPAVEDQATDRAHRIGQDRPVQVHRLIAEGTLEDRIATMLERKRGLAEAVVGEGEAWLTEMSDAELADLVHLGALGEKPPVATGRRSGGQAGS
jgi:superfamily II DNA or RNA helicase